jgi:hypothetical protein
VTGRRARGWLFAFAVPFVLWAACGLLALRAPVPPALRPASRAGWLRGAVHVHTDRSHDGRGSLAEVAGAAREAGLDFIVVTDHDREPLPPQVVDGVLIVPGAERSTSEGHRLELGPEGAQRIAAAHPLFARAPWKDWAALPDDAGVEALATNALIADAGLWRVLAAAPAFPFAPEAALVSLYERPEAALAAFDARALRGAWLLCSADAHGIVPYRRELGLLVMHVPAERSGDAGRDAAAVVDALPRGYCAVGPFGDARGYREAREGARLRVRLDYDPPLNDAELVLWRGGVSAGTVRGAEAEFTLSEGASHRVEVRISAPRLYLGERRATWIYGPVYR